jgi:hypothetical protein
LRQEIGFAGLDFLRGRIPIFRRTAFEHIADVNIVSAKAHFVEELIEEFAGTPNKRHTLQILIASGSFTHEDDIRLWIPVTEDEFRARLSERTADAISNLFLEVRQGCWKRIQRSAKGFQPRFLRSGRQIDFVLEERLLLEVAVRKLSGLLNGIAVFCHGFFFFDLPL